MHQPAPINVQFGRSRCAVALVIALHASTAALVVGLPIALDIRVGGVLAVAALCVLALERLIGSASAVRIRVCIDRRITVATRGGREYEGAILGGGYVGARLTTIVWRPSG